MDSIGQIFSGGGGAGGGGGWLSQIMPYLALGGAGSSLIGNIMANRSRNAVLSAEMAQMSKLSKLTPAQITQGISAIEQPLSGNLIKTLTNNVQGQMAERGLSQAPGIFAQSIASAEAPYAVQEQQLAQDAFFKQLGLPISARPSPFGPYPQTSNTNQLWQALFQRYMTPQGPSETPMAGNDPTVANLVAQWNTPNFGGGSSGLNLMDLPLMTPTVPSGGGSDFFNMG